MESLEDKIKFSESELNQPAEGIQIHQEEEQRQQEEQQEEQQEQPQNTNIEPNPLNLSNQPPEPLPTISDTITSDNQHRLFINEMTPKEIPIQSETETLTIQTDKAKSIIYTDTSQAIQIYNECSNKISQLLLAHSTDNTVLPQLHDLKYKILNNLAICYIYSKQYLKAIETDNLILQLNNAPKEQSLLRLFKSHKELGEIDKALQYSNDIKRTVPQSILEQNQSILHDINELHAQLNKDNEHHRKETSSFMNNILLYSIPLLAAVSIGVYIYIKKK